jgi:hypothetical protein
MGENIKPQLISLDAGRHNSDLEASGKRIMVGGSWKKQRIVLIIPAASQLPTKAAMAIWSLAFPPNQSVYRMAAIGMEVGEAYCNAIESVLANPELSQWEYILTVESDNIPPWNGVGQLLESMEAHPEYACIGGLYWTKGEGGVPQIWGDPADPVLNYRPQVPLPNTIQECCGTGMGFNLWRLSLFKDERIKKPWFRTLNGSTGEGIGTQDLTFWTEARKHGYRCAIDTRVLVGHYDYINDITW